MGFTTETFLFIFLPATILICLCVSAKHLRTCALLLNAAFYLWAGLETALVFITLIVACYLFGHLIENAKEDRRKWTAFAVGAAVIALVYYKYLAFLCDNINALLGDATHLEFSATTVAPLGISFVIFSAISYFSDIFMGGGSGGFPMERGSVPLVFPETALWPHCPLEGLCLAN